MYRFLSSAQKVFILFYNRGSDRCAGMLDVFTGYSCYVNGEVFSQEATRRWSCDLM